jgi:hypothetical protein
MKIYAFNPVTGATDELVTTNIEHIEFDGEADDGVEYYTVYCSNDIYMIMSKEEFNKFVVASQIHP